MQNYIALPRLHRRGPIEAITCLDIAQPRTGLFHGFIAVAPLKPAATRSFHELRRSSTASSPWPH